MNPKRLFARVNKEGSLRYRAAIADLTWPCRLISRKSVGRAASLAGAPARDCGWTSYRSVRRAADLIVMLIPLHLLHGCSTTELRYNRSEVRKEHCCSA